MDSLKCVLLVDDDNVSNYLNRRLLLSHHKIEEVVCARNGKEALEILKERQQSDSLYPTVIFLDINMPVMNGFDFITEYDRTRDDRTPAARIIMLSSSSDQRDVAKAKDVGVKEFLAKPLNSSKLQELFAGPQQRS